MLCLLYVPIAAGGLRILAAHFGYAGGWRVSWGELLIAWLFWAAGSVVWIILVRRFGRFVERQLGD